MPYDLTQDIRPKMKITDIVIPPDRQRKEYKGIQDLANDIRENSLIQPIVVTKIGSAPGKATLVAGGRRLRACMLVSELGGMIPFVLREELSVYWQKRMELSENLFRENLSAFEHIDALNELHELQITTLGQAPTDSPEESGWSLKKTADVAGITKQLAATQIAFSKKLKARPDHRELVKNLPLDAAMRVVAAKEEAEKMERLQSSGQLTLTTELAHSDALSYLKSLKADSVNLFLTDPPFGMEELETRRGESFKSENSSQVYTAQMTQHDNSTKDAVLSLLASLAPEMFRVLKPTFHSYVFFEMDLLGDLLSIFRSAGFSTNLPILIWDKGRSTNPFRGYNYLSCYEAIFYLSKGKEPRRLTDSCSSILHFSPLHATKKIHIFEKPIELLAKLIKQSTNIGDLVCDPFAGSGATLAAAKQTGRRASGCELDKDHFLLAQKRLLGEKDLLAGAVK